MSELHVRIVSEADNAHRWMVVDHIWDGISAPLAISDEIHRTAEEARIAGETALQQIQDDEARDHPLQD